MRHAIGEKAVPDYVEDDWQALDRLARMPTPRRHRRMGFGQPAERLATPFAADPEHDPGDARGMPVHRSAKLRAWLAGREAEIEVFYLPGYSPELNPNEGINGDLKQTVTRKEPARSKAQLKRAVLGHMRGLSKSPNRVRSFFLATRPSATPPNSRSPGPNQ
ncbi:MAG TPA: transposase [Frateuria sp.]|uniref:transposase n=1 Tax=Frateuria sp. TaxID=2211372 RepID=UPI002D80AA35|nr:transposase [Frateuria sp.]HET6804190.1 transposase [Frateuria sp.]